VIIMFGAYPLQITVYHPLAVHIHQSLNNTFELQRSGTGHQCRAGSTVRTKTYKFEPIRILVYLDELIDVPIGHPFRYHRKLVVSHRHS